MLINTKIEQAQLCWQIGDWSSLVDLEHGEQPQLLLYVAAAWYQLGGIEKANGLLSGIELKGQEKDLARKLLISGVYNVLGKARACANQYQQAENLCRQSLQLDPPVSESVLNARVSEQFAQLGIPRLPDNVKPAVFSPDYGSFLQAANKLFSQEPAQQIAQAEYHQLKERFDDAIVNWQNVSGLLGSYTPQQHYDRLKDAYKSVKGFPLGSVEQETLRGDIDKHKLLSEIHKQLQPQFYFEIGVQTGKSLALAKCEALGIDPMPMLNQELPQTAKVITASSDAFFMKQADVLLSKSIDLCFIDGMHLFEYALRDFINVEKYAKPHSLIVIDDIFPGHPDQANRQRCTRAWTGDVWKVKAILEKYRPDLFIVAIDAYPTGLLLITALNPEDTILDANYQSIVDEYMAIDSVPNQIVARDNSISGKSEKVRRQIECLKVLGAKRVTSNEIKQELTDIIQLA